MLEVERQCLKHYFISFYRSNETLNFDFLLFKQSVNSKKILNLAHDMRRKLRNIIEVIELRIIKMNRDHFVIKAPLIDHSHAADGFCAHQRKRWNNGAPNTADYGYVSNGKCFIGLGDSNVWWAFDKDMNACRDTAVTLVVQRCNCLDGRTKWGQLRVIDADLTAGVHFTEFKVTVKKPDGTVVMSNVNLLGTDGYLDLNSVPTDVVSLTLEVEATSVAGYPAWAGGHAPKIDVRYREVPALVDPV